MAFIHDQMTIIGNNIGNYAISNQALHEGDIDLSGWLPLSTINHAKLGRLNIKKGLETCHPLVEKLSPMDQN